MSADDPKPQNPTPSNYRRTTGGHLHWKPPTVEHLQGLLSGYEVLEMLGAGGMGAVYKARQISLDRLVAIKILPPEVADAEMNFAERFRNEARTMARMNHPAIVSVYDFGQTSEGQLYIVMEFIDGTDVAQMILAQGKLPADYALAITAHVCDALQYAHDHGVIHRDIKPANVLINREGQVKVADFGLAKASDAGGGGLTKTNMAMGTPDFVAPEALVAGMPLDGRADLYAIGVMLYNMLTGEIPRGMFAMPSLKSGTDRRFDAIIAKAMQTDRESRYQSAIEIRADLDRIVTVPLVQTGGQSSAAIPKQVVARVAESQLPKAGSKGKAGPILAGAFTLMALIGLYAFFRAGPDSVDPQSGRIVATKTSDPQAASAPARPVEVPGPPAAVKSDQPRPVGVTQETPANAPAARQPQVAADAPPIPLPDGIAKQSLDLLALTDPTQDRIANPGRVGANEWVREAGALIYRSDGKTGQLAAPVSLNCRDYEMELHAHRLEGAAGLVLDLPIGNGRILPLIFHDPERLLIHNQAGPKWPVSPDRVSLSIRFKAGAGGEADRLIIRRIDAGGQVLVDWSGEAESLGKPGDSHPQFPGRQVASVHASRGSYSLKVWRLQVFDGEAEALREQPKVAAANLPPANGASPAGTMTANAGTAPPVLVEAGPVAKRLAELEEQFARAFDQQAGKTYQTALTMLNASYVAALDRALAASTKSGNLEESLAIRGEKERIAADKSLPPADLETLPATLKAMRATYRQSEARLAAERDKAAMPLYDFYDQALSRYQAELTQQQKLDDALKVKTRRDEVGRAGRRWTPAPPRRFPARSHRSPAQPKRPQTPPSLL